MKQFSSYQVAFGSTNHTADGRNHRWLDFMPITLAKHVVERPTPQTTQVANFLVFAFLRIGNTKHKFKTERIQTGEVMFGVTFFWCPGCRHLKQRLKGQSEASWFWRAQRKQGWILLLGQAMDSAKRTAHGEKPANPSKTSKRQLKSTKWTRKIKYCVRACRS